MHSRTVRCAVGLSLVIAAGRVNAQCCKAESAFEPVDSALNQFTYTLQHLASMDGAEDGRMVVAWASRRQEAMTYGVFARLTDELGRPIGDEVHVNAYMPGTQTEPAVAVAPNGDTWIAWASDHQDGDRGSIIARRFRMTDEALEPVGGEIAINETREGHQHRPGIASLDDGTTMVTWTNTSIGGQNVLGRIFDAEGNAVTGEIALTGDDAQMANNPSVIAAGDRFVAAWGARLSDGTPAGIYARCFDRTGLGADAFEVVPSSVASIEPSLDADAKGNLVIAWLETQDTRGYDAKARRFDAEGTPLGETMTIATCVDSWKSGVTVAVADDGRFCVSYTTETGLPSPDEMRPGMPSDIIAKFFDAEGNPIGEPMRMHAATDGRQASHANNARRGVWGSREMPAFSWEGQTGFDGSGVAISTLAPSEIARAMAPVAQDMGVDFTREQVAESTLIPPVFDADWVAPPPDDRVRPAGTDFGFEAWSGTGWTPPDPDISVGPNTLVGVVNVEGKIFDHQGNLLFVQDLVPFFAPVGANGFVFDPIAVYDRHTGRHIIAAVEHTGGNNTSWLNVAVSTNSDPQNGNDWHKYRLNTTTPTGGGTFLDYPNMGVDEDAIYITGDYFGGAGGNWVHMFDKAPMLDGDPTSMNVLRTSGSLRSLGATNHIDADAPGGYFATSFGNSSTQITLQAITDPNGSPQLTSRNISVPFYQQPPGAAQQGSGNRISTVDLRIKNCVYRNGSLWAAHNIGIDGVARVRFYEFEMNGWPTSGNQPTLAQSGEIDLGNGIYTFFGDPGVDAQNNLVMQFNRSSSNEFVSIQRTFRLAGDDPGTVRETREVQTSTNADNSGRWGDYTGIDEDPDDPSTFWAHDEYTRNGWRTWFGQIKLSGLNISFPNGLPDIIDPAGATIRVEVEGTGGSVPLEGSGKLFYDLENDGTFVEVAMDVVSANVYDAHLPSVACLETVDYYFSAQDTNGQDFTSPGGAPASFYSALAVGDMFVSFADDFETDMGWTAENLGASSGDWQRGVPVDDPGWDYDPSSDGDGSGSAFLTQNENGNTDVDGGSVRLTSPAFDMSADAEWSIDYFYYLRLTSSDAEDGLMVEISSNGVNGPWTTVIDHRSDGGTGWRTHSISESDLAGLGVALTDDMRVRFTARDNDPQSINEAGVDGFVVSGLGCDDTGCPADLDGDGDADADDFFAYLDLFSGGDDAADIDQDGDIDADDFFAYLDLFAAGC